MSCLFRALAAFHNGIATQQMRHYICAYLSKDPQLGGEKASQVIPWETNLSLNQYIQNMTNQNEWGGAIEIKAYCDLFKKNVKVISGPNRREIEFLSRKKNVNEWHVISWNGYHYEPVRQYFIDTVDNPKNVNNDKNNDCNCDKCRSTRN